MWNSVNTLPIRFLLGHNQFLFILKPECFLSLCAYSSLLRPKLITQLFSQNDNVYVKDFLFEMQTSYAYTYTSHHDLSIIIVLNQFV